MADCRCEEMGVLKREISQLEEVRELQYSFNRYMNEAKEYLQAAARDSQRITECESVRESEIYIVNLTDEMEAVKARLLEKIENKLSDMRSRLSDMKSEDERHHQEEEEKEKLKRQNGFW